MHIQPQRLRELLEYDALTGVVSRRKTKRKLVADQDGLVIIYDNSNKRSYKLKLDRIAYCLGYGAMPRAEQRVLHKNLDAEDNRLINLVLVSRATFLKIKEADKNLSGGIRMQAHNQDQFSYTVHWYEKSIEKQKVVSDIVLARRLMLKLQLKYSKILTKYCVFD